MTDATHKTLYSTRAQWTSVREGYVTTEAETVEEAMENFSRGDWWAEDTKGEWDEKIISKIDPEELVALDRRMF